MKTIYWMARDQRFSFNKALYKAQQFALKSNSELEVVFCLTNFLNANKRMYWFMLLGLQEVVIELQRHNIAFKLLIGDPSTELVSYINSQETIGFFTDYSPLKISKEWKAKVSQRVKIPLTVVDAHNLVPVEQSSSKQEYMARTFRPKILKQLTTLDVGKSEIKTHPVFAKTNMAVFNYEETLARLNFNDNVEKVTKFLPGYSNAKKVLREFIDSKIVNYSNNRNNPNLDSLSNLSPYLHFGQIGALEIYLEILRVGDPNLTNTFIEEFVVRRELAENYCHYNSDYDNFNGFPNWAKATLTKHLPDKRKYIYDPDQFENAQTHDELWNSCQKEMLITGKMHGYLRMYWAKKILEWSERPQDAQKVAIYLNDKYELDGRDPNGYTGIAWAIGGVHDRPWPERPIYGTVRSMSYEGCAKKFDVLAFISKYSFAR